MVSFKTENEKHTQAFNKLKAVYEPLGWSFLEFPGKNDEGCDFIMIDPDLSMYRVELKSMAGASKDGRAYPTFLLETYTDHDKIHKTEWRKPNSKGQMVDILIEVNRYDNTAYIFDAQLLRDYVSRLESEQCPMSASGIGTGQYGKQNKDCSWGYKIPWQSTDAGFISCRKLTL